MTAVSVNDCVISVKGGVSDSGQCQGWCDSGQCQGWCA